MRKKHRFSKISYFISLPKKFALIFFVALLVSGASIFLWTAYAIDANPPLFEDGFESGDFESGDFFWDSFDSNWEVREEAKHDGFQGAEVRGDTEGESILLKNASTSGYQNIELSYWYKVKKSLEEDDHLYVEWSTDGSSWNELAHYTDVDDGDWTPGTFPLPFSANNQEGFRFQFRADFNDAGHGDKDEVLLDDVLLTGEEPEGRISGHKWYDVNGYGLQDPDEPPIRDWTIVISDGESTYYPYTDDNGYYDSRNEITGLYEGTYTICEELPFETGWTWTQSYPYDGVENAVRCNDEQGFAPWGYEVTIEGDAEVTLDFGNTIALVSVHAHKFNDLNESGEQDEGEPSLPGWKICLYPDRFANEQMWSWWDDFFSDEPDKSNETCRLTDGNDDVSWNVPPGEYQMYEQMSGEQQDEGWQQTVPYNGNYYVVVGGEAVSYYDGDYEVDAAKFGNWLLNWNEDPVPPESHFDDPLDHEIIETEIVSLSLTGGSVDNLSGISEVTLEVRQMDSFFDVFYEIDCSSNEATIETEILSMDLMRVDPVTVSWAHEWEPSSPGVYCFRVQATDNNGNVENGVFAGPVAYIPVAPEPEPELPPVISQETTESIPALINNLAEFIVRWVTDHVATSRVIYDTVSRLVLGDSPCPDPLDALNCYGYAFSTIEDPALVINHEVVVSGLLPDTTYFYRSVSHGSPESVGNEQSITTPPSFQPSQGFLPYPFVPQSSDAGTPPPSDQGSETNELTSQESEPGEATPPPPTPPQSPAVDEPSEEPSSLVSDATGGSPAPEEQEGGTAIVTSTGEGEEGIESQEESLSTASLSEGDTGESSQTAFQEEEEASVDTFLAAVFTALTPLQWMLLTAFGSIFGFALLRIYVRIKAPSQSRKK